MITDTHADFHLTYTIIWGTSAFVCALFSFFFATCEMAFTTVSLNKWNQIYAKGKNLNNRLVKKMLENYQITLGVVLIGNVVTTIVASTFIANIVGQFVEKDILTFLSFVIAFFLLIFCEYFPKSLARNKPIQWLKITSILLYVFYVFLYPSSKLFSIMFTRKNKIVDPTSVEYNIMNFKDALVSDKMIPVEKAEKLILEGSNEEILQKIILTKHLTLPVVNSKNEIQGCIRTDVYLKHYLNDGDTDPRPYLKKIKLISKNAVMSDVIALANKDQPIVGVINSRNPNKLIGIISVNHIMRLLSTDVFSHNR